MITLEEYELAYNLYTEGRILEATTTALEIKAITESSILEEGAAEAIRNFINKIISGMQNAWNKFKDNMDKHKIKYKESEVRDAISKYKINVSVTNFIDYNIYLLKKIDFKPLDYTSMQTSLTDKDTFMRKYYSNIYSNKDKSIYDNLLEKCTISKEDKRALTSEDMTKMVDFVYKYEEVKKKVEGDLSKINQSAKTGEAIAAQAESAEMRLKETLDYYFNEGEDGEAKTEAPKVEKSESNPDQGNPNDSNKKPNDEQQKKVQTYFACMSDLLSSELKLSRQIYLFYCSAINQHMKNVSKNKKDNEKDNNKNNAETKDNTSDSDGVKQLDI